MSGNTPRPRNTGSRRPPAKKTAKTAATRSAAGSRAKSRKATGSQGKKPALSRKDKFRKWLRIGLIGAVVATLVMTAIFYIAYRATDIPDPNTAFQAQTTKVYYAGGKRELGSFAVQNRESIPLADIPQVMQDAAVAAEDRTFWTNRGIDPKGIIRAAFSNAKGGATQGASTITQQYVKLLYLSQERTLKRKIKEAFLSLKIQQQQSKSQILEGYLNTVYFGRGAYGVQAAANAFFGIPAGKLNAGQSAMLAAVLNSPTYLSPDRGKEGREALLGRYQYVLSSMAEMGTLDSARADKLKRRLPKLAKRSTSNSYGGQKGFMLEMVKDELLGLGFDETQIEAGGLRITTTFSRKAMNAARAAIAEVRPTGVKKLRSAIASVDVKTGALLGFYGGQDYIKSQLNWAETALPPGSAFKPFAVAAGIKDGFSLRDTFEGNSPYTYPDGSQVVNEGGTDYGSRVSLTTATQKSINTAFVDMTAAMDNGPEKIAKMAESLGVPKLKQDQVNSGISLGGNPVSPIDMANAYAAIADGGLAHDTFVVTKVRRASDGEVLYTAPERTKRVLDSDIAADTSYAMQQVVEAGTGTAAKALGRPAGGKTGTATNNDKRVITSWFVGFTPQVATAVMYARDTGYKPIDEGYLPDYAGLRGYFGANYPARTWTAAMQRIMEGEEVEQFPEPVYVDGDAPDSGHDPVPTSTPTPTKKPKPTKKPTPTAEPTETPEPVVNGVCSDVAGDPDCPVEPVLNGQCSDVPGDPDCPQEPTQNGVCSDVEDDPDCITESPCPPLNPNCHDPIERTRAPEQTSGEEVRPRLRARPEEPV